MNLAELLVAAPVLAISASASLQVWASGSQWSVRGEQQRQQHAGGQRGRGQHHVRQELEEGEEIHGGRAPILDRRRPGRETRRSRCADAPARPP